MKSLNISLPRRFVALLFVFAGFSEGWVQRTRITELNSAKVFSYGRKSTELAGSLHGENACFLPLKQLDNDYYAPRILQIAGAYPGLTHEEFSAVTSEPPAEQGQWQYDFSDPDGPQVGTVALDGTNTVAACEDPVVIIAEHTSLNVILPPELEEAADLLVVVDRGIPTFAERKFLVYSSAGATELTIGAFAEKSDVPDGTTILGQVVLVQIPWLPCMQKTKTGFMEEDEYF